MHSMWVQTSQVHQELRSRPSVPPYQPCSSLITHFTRTHVHRNHGFQAGFPQTPRKTPFTRSLQHPAWSKTSELSGAENGSAVFVLSGMNWRRSVVKYGAQSQSGIAIKLFQGASKNYLPFLTQVFHPWWWETCRVIQQQFCVKECDILWGIKTHSDPSYVFWRLRPSSQPPRSAPLPWIAPGIRDAYAVRLC